MFNLKEIQATRTQINATIKCLEQLDQMLLKYGVLGAKKNASYSEPKSYEVLYPLTANAGIFKGQKPTGVIFGEERVSAGTWKKVFAEILAHCVKDVEKRNALMNLRGKISGRERVILAKESDQMRKAHKISENLYIETHYDTETLLRILLTRVLDPIGYDYSNIKVALRNTP